MDGLQTSLSALFEDGLAQSDEAVRSAGFSRSMLEFGDILTHQAEVREAALRTISSFTLQLFGAAVHLGEGGGRRGERKPR